MGSGLAMELPYFLRLQTNLCLNEGKKREKRALVYDIHEVEGSFWKCTEDQQVQKDNRETKLPTAELYALVYRGLGTERI